MAQLLPANSNSFLKSPCLEDSESVIDFSGGLHFTRLDSGEQCNNFSRIVFYRVIYDRAGKKG